MSKLRSLKVLVAVTLLLAGGAGAALAIRSRREVTTSSAEALRHYRLGRENELKMYEREAASSFAEALRYDPHFVMATIHLAGYLRQRDPARASSIVECVSRYRDDLTPREQLTLKLFEAQIAKDEAKVDALIDEYGKRFPKDPEGYQLRAGRFARKGKSAEAIAEYERLLAVNPNYAIAYNSLGYYHAKMGNFAKGEDYLKRYRFLASDQANPYDSLGELYANIGRYEEAEESLKKALGVKSDFFPAVAHLGTMEVGRGNMVAAAQHFARAFELADLATTKVEFASYAAFALASAGKPDEARQMLAKIDAEVKDLTDAEKKRVDASMKMNRVAVLTKLGEPDEAEKVLASVVAPTPEAGSKWDSEEFGRNQKLLTAMIANARGKYDDAVTGMLAALPKSENPMGGFDYFPYGPLVRVNLAESLRQLGRIEEAENVLKSVLTRNPRFQPAVQEMARLKETSAETVARRS